MIYARFWRRLVAYWIDAFPILVVTSLAFYFFFGFDVTLRTYLHGPRDFESRMAFISARSHIRVLSFLIWLIYSCIMDASAYQGTLGKRLLGMRVVDETGGRLSITRSLARNSAKILSLLLFFLGFMWIGWSKTKQGWHDQLAHSFVVLDAKHIDPPTTAWPINSTLPEPPGTNPLPKP